MYFNCVGLKFYHQLLFQVLEHYVIELNNGPTRQQRGETTVQKLKNWFKNERQREKRIQNREMDRATQEQQADRNRRKRLAPRRTESLGAPPEMLVRLHGSPTDRHIIPVPLFMNETGEILVYESGTLNVNMKGTDDPILGAPSPRSHSAPLKSPHDLDSHDLSTRSPGEFVVRGPGSHDKGSSRRFDDVT